MTKHVCCNQVVELENRVVKIEESKRTLRSLVVVGVALLGIAASVWGPQVNASWDKLDANLDTLVETTHQTELKVGHIAVEQVYLRRDLTAHMDRTEGRPNQ